MTPFVTELGTGYMNEMLSGAPFLYEGDAYLFSEIMDKSKAMAFKLGPTAEQCQAEATVVPVDIFDGWKAFSFPTLGYRSSDRGQVLTYLTRTNSTRRGLNPRDMQMVFHDVSYQCSRMYGTNLNHYNTTNVRAFMAMKPEYTKFMVGMEKILKGEIASFALSAEFAVAPSDNVPFLEILFRQRRIGTIDESGNVSIDVEGTASAWHNVVNGEISNE